MRLLYSALLLAGSLFAQTDAVADRMLARAGAAPWGAMYTGRANCQPRTQLQSSAHVTDRWAYACASTANGLVEQSFFYSTGRNPGLLLHRVDVRTAAASPGLARILRERLTKKLGAPRDDGDHWAASNLHYFLKGAELTVVDDRLFEERERDDFAQETALLSEPVSPATAFFQRTLGDFYTKLIDADSKTPAARAGLAQATSREALNLLQTASRALHEERAMLLLAVNGLVTKLSTLLWVNDENGEREIPAAAPIRADLAKFGVKLGGMLHNNGVLAYHQDLLWRVWREFPDTEAGSLAFVELQQRGWYNGPDIGCPANPDSFHDVIENGEAFLARHPTTKYRKEVLFTLAIANESWWSIARAPADDGWVGEIPYPRKNADKQQAEAARQRAIKYYQEIVDLAPGSAEAASAALRLPRLKSGRDSGQRRFFCSYC